MPNRSFFWFFLPAGLAMILFIGLPIISTGIQSFYAQHDQILVEVLQGNESAEQALKDVEAAYMTKAKEQGFL